MATTLVDFAGTADKNPAGNLLGESDGTLIGTAGGGTPTNGAVGRVLFSVTSSTTNPIPTPTPPTPIPTPIPINTSPLVPTIKVSTLPAAAVSENAVKGTVHLTIDNSTAEKSKTLGSVTLYASANGTIDDSSIKLTPTPHKFAVKDGATAAVSLPVKNVKLAAGTYTLLAQLVDSAGGISTSAGGTITVSPATIALAGTISAVKPTQITPGKVLSFTLALTNSGNVYSVGKAQLAISLSSDGVSATVPAETLRKLVKIKAGGRPVILHLKLKVPTSATAMNLVPLVVVTQGDTTVTIAGTTSVVVG